MIQVWKAPSDFQFTQRIRSQLFCLCVFFIHLSLSSTELRRWREWSRHSEAVGRSRCQGQEPSSGNYEGSEGTRRMKRTSAALVKTCCSSPFRGNFPLMRESYSEKVCFQNTCSSSPDSVISESSFSNPKFFVFQLISNVPSSLWALLMTSPWRSWPERCPMNMKWQVSVDWWQQKKCQ